MLIGRKKSNSPLPDQPFRQHRIKMLLKSGPLFYLCYNFRLFFTLLWTPADIIHAVDLDTLTAAYCAARIKGAKLVYDAHEYFTEVPELQGKKMKQAIWKWVERRYVTKADARITVGQSIAELFQNEYGTQFAVVRNAPVSSEMQHNIEAEKFLLYQGALNKGRGLELLIDCMSDIEIPLVIAGSGDLDAELHERCKKAGVEDKVTFTGMLPPEELRTLTNKAYIGYNVMENLGLSYYYSLSNKFFDYIHAGVPALTNDFPEYLKLNEQYDCVLLTKHTRDSLLQNILLLLNDNELYGKMKKNCFLAAQELNWREEEKILADVYDRIS